MSGPPALPREGCLRLERIGRASVVVMVVALAGLTVWAARSLFADGSFYLWTFLSTGHPFSYLSRVVAQTVTQLPLLLAAQFGVDDVATLARVQSFGVGAVPVLMWVGALVYLRASELFWLWVVAFAVVYLNAGFMTIGEYNLAYAIVALSAAVLLRERRLPRGARPALLVLAALLCFCYESLVVLIPVLAILALSRHRREREATEKTAPSRWWVWILLGIYSLAEGIAAYFVIVPRDPKNLGSAADLIGAVTTNHQLLISSIIAVSSAVVWAFVSGRARVACFAVLGLASLGLAAVPAVWATPGQQYEARTAVALVLAAILTLAWLGRSGGKDARIAPAGRTAFAVSASLMLISLAVPFAITTAGFAFWIRDVDRAVSAPGGVVTLAASGLPEALTARYDWSWTNPYLSRVLQDAPGEVTILVPSETEANHAPLPAEILGRFQTGGLIFP